jgi:hypothetical protein
MPMYFGPQVDEKIIDYRNEIDVEKKNAIFTEHIRPAMLKLIESQMYLYGFYKIDDPDMLKNECLATLYETLPKFDPSKGKKAFSYFNVVVKNWFIWKIRDKNKKLKQQSENFYGIDHDRVKNDPSIVLSPTKMRSSRGSSGSPSTATWTSGGHSSRRTRSERYLTPSSSCCRILTSSVFTTRRPSFSTSVK